MSIEFTYKSHLPLYRHSSANNMLQRDILLWLHADRNTLGDHLTIRRSINSFRVRKLSFSIPNRFIPPHPDSFVLLTPFFLRLR